MTHPACKGHSSRSVRLHCPQHFCLVATLCQARSMTSALIMSCLLFLLLLLLFLLFLLLPLRAPSRPRGSKRSGPRRLLTHRCYSNAFRESWPNMTSDPACQLIHRHLFWKRFSTSINYPIFPPCPSNVLCLAPAIFSPPRAPRSTNSDCTVAENLSPWVHRGQRAHTRVTACLYVSSHQRLCDE